MSPQPDCQARKIEELDIYIRAYNNLLRANVLTFGDLLSIFRKGRTAINKIRNFGEFALQQSLENLEIMGCLPEDLPLDVDVRTQAKRLRWLKNSQAVNGSWFNNPEITIAALLSAVRTPNTLFKEDMEKGLHWIRQMRLEIEDSILIYAIDRTIAEYNSTLIPECPFDLPNSESQSRGAESINELRLMAIIRGDAIKKPHYYDSHRPSTKLGITTYKPIEIMWMTVGEPDS